VKTITANGPAALVCVVDMIVHLISSYPYFPALSCLEGVYKQADDAPAMAVGLAV